MQKQEGTVATATNTSHGTNDCGMNTATPSYISDPLVSFMADTKAYHGKPDAGVVTNSMKSKSYKLVNVPISRLVNCVSRGYTFMCGVYEDNAWNSQIEGQQLFCLDFDNDTEVWRRVDSLDGFEDCPRCNIVRAEDDGYFVKCADADGRSMKRPLLEHEPGFISPEGVFKRSLGFGWTPAFIYYSASSSPDNPRFHVVFDNGSMITDKAEIVETIQGLHEDYPECDHSCTNLNRLYFGSLGCEVWPLWDYDFEEV